VPINLLDAVELWFRQWWRTVVVLVQPDTVVRWHRDECRARLPSTGSPQRAGSIRFRPTEPAKTL
jgi:hypothetical protein